MTEDKKATRDRNITVIDVEAVGLHGPAFAVAMHTFAPSGEVLHEAVFYCDYKLIGIYAESDLRWVAENCKPHLWRELGLGASTLLPLPRQVRDRFWQKWLEIKEKYDPLMAADVPVPVESRFLEACVDDSKDRWWELPYPLIDVASVRFGLGLDPLADEERLEGELPTHHPLADARQSARLLREALSGAREDSMPPFEVTR